MTKAMAEQYRRLPKIEKGAIFEQMVVSTSYRRSYSAGLVRQGEVRIVSF